jgi:23S rRNA-/tRNA-specific pseudouridylate synthase
MTKSGNSLSSINLVALFVRLIYCLKTQIYDSYYTLQPVHAAGRYFRNSLVEILKDDFGFEKIYSMWQLGTPRSMARSLNLSPATNRLDRLTSGLMIIPLSAECASSVSKEFAEGKVRKEYIARCKGEFPAYVLPVD